jgi:hypothetical protein
LKFNSVKELVLFEHQFWLQILGDHSRFIFTSLAPKETSFIDQANEFVTKFDSLLETSHKSMSSEELSTLNYEAYKAAIKIRNFKLSILSKQLEDKIDISLPPTFINHMLNELDEYIIILNALIKGKIPAAKALHLHLLWLSDGVGHASTIANNLDVTQKDSIKKSKDFSKIFTDLYSTSAEYNGYTRTGICDFPALRKLNEDADETMMCFKEFLKELLEYILQHKVLGTISPLIPDHMLREECYYLTKLSMVSNTKDPGCNPTKPRIET